MMEEELCVQEMTAIRSRFKKHCVVFQLGTRPVNYHDRESGSDVAGMRLDGCVQFAANVMYYDVRNPASEDDEMIQLPRLRAVAAYPERDGAWSTIFDTGAALDQTGIVCVGGNNRQDERGVGGLFVVTGVKKKEVSPFEAMRLNGYIGMVAHADQIPAGLFAYPEGHKRDASLPARHPYSLFYNRWRPGGPEANKRLKSVINVMFDHLDQDMAVSAGSLVPPALFVKAPPHERLLVREANLDDRESLDALWRLNRRMAENAYSCHWPLPDDFEGVVQSPCDGIIYSVTEEAHGSYRFDYEDGSAVTTATIPSIIRYMGQRLITKPLSLQIHPLVQPGDRIMAGQSLVGPLEQTDSAAWSFDDVEEPLDAARVWTIFTEMKQYMFPWQHVSISAEVSNAENYIYADIAGCRLQTILLARRASNLLAASSPGLAIDMYNSSHRDLARLRVRQNRQDKQQSNEHAPAGSDA